MKEKGRARRTATLLGSSATVLVWLAIPVGTMCCRAGSAALVGSAAPSPRRSTSEAANEGPRIIPLAESLSPLRDWFNHHTDQPRFIALLSPT